VNEITDELWITDIETVRFADKSQFDQIITVCQDCVGDNISDDTEYYCFNIADDEESAENWGGSYHYPRFEEAALTLLRGFRDDSISTSLIHCHKGRNRSVAVCAAAMGVYYDITYGEAYGRIQDARGIANPNHIMEGHAKRFITERQ
jgi:protein-tyrosine phosphatase